MYTDNTNHIFKRMNLQQISTFLLEGLENPDDDFDTYSNRIKRSSNALIKRLECICPNEEELDRVVADLSDTLIAYESVYTQIGMKFGERMLFELLLKDDNTGDCETGID